MSIRKLNEKIEKGHLYAMSREDNLPQGFSKWSKKERKAYMERYNPDEAKHMFPGPNRINTHSIMLSMAVSTAMARANRIAKEKEQALLRRKKQRRAKAKLAKAA